MAQEAAVGAVTVDRVSLERVIPMVGNAYKPIFVGRFVESGGTVRLQGRFTINWLAKLFMAVWFGLITVMGFGASIAAARQRQGWIIPLFALGMLVAGLVLVRVGQWFSRRDPACLSAVIGTALGSPSSAATATLLAPKPGLPRHILPFIAVIVFGGLQLVGFGLAGISSFQIDAQHHLQVTYFEDESLRRYLSVFYGGLALAWAYGVYRQYRLAWWIGVGFLVLFGIGILSAPLNVPASIPTAGAPPQLPIMFKVIGGLAVLAVWGWWWYGQRRHFRN